jgi:hypothetical protein
VLDNCQKNEQEMVRHQGSDFLNGILINSIGNAVRGTESISIYVAQTHGLT